METGLYNDYRKVTGEQVRMWLRTQKVRKPEHTNTYGALILNAINRGLLRPTGDVVRATDPKAKGRLTPVYTVKRQRSIKTNVA